MPRIMQLELLLEDDLVGARQRAREIAAALDLDTQDQTRLATAVSELARNAYVYAGGGTIAFDLVSDEAGGSLVVTVEDHGPGIPNVDGILRGEYRSKTGLGVGLVGSQRLVDLLEVTTSPAGTRVVLTKHLDLPGSSSLARVAAELAAQLTARPPSGPMDEVRRQNRELLDALDLARDRQEQAERLSQELEETNRGIIALHAELEERLEDLRAASEAKSRFLSSVGHELRTPVNAIRALAGILLHERDHAQVVQQAALIGDAAVDLTGLVDDLLDLAKAEANRLEIEITEVDLNDVLTALRGLMRPLAVNPDVELLIDTAPVTHIRTDEQKLQQILRNLVSNALKFTERGRVHVAVGYDAEGDVLTITVADTGIGIPHEYQSRIFDEFSQVPNRLQPDHKGTGLGLALVRRLVGLLDGTVSVASVPDQGSTFTVAIPGRISEDAESSAGHEASRGGTRVLVVDDDPRWRYVVRSYLDRPPYQVMEAMGGRQALDAISTDPPDAVILDLVMPDVGGHEVLTALRDDAATAAIPVIMCTSVELSESERRMLVALSQGVISKQDLDAQLLIEHLDSALRRAPTGSEVPS